MRRLLEQRTPSHSSSSSSYAASQKSKAQFLAAMMGFIVLSAYMAFFVLPRLSLGDEEFPTTRGGGATTLVRNAVASTYAPPPLISRPLRSVDDESSQQQQAANPKDNAHHRGNTGGGGVEFKNGVGRVPSIVPWGYNVDRNVPRWAAIYKSIAADRGITIGKDGRDAALERRPPFSVVDHGADQGYFSISIAKFFPEATVIGLELGGVGGAIWNKKPLDVLQVQEDHLDENQVASPRMIICQTRMNPSHFFELRTSGSVVDYQLMLSVFHWFELPTRERFELALVALFQTARTTFLELPTIGDRSAMIRKQVGYERFAVWYDGRTNIQTILEDTAKNQHIQLSITKILDLKWVGKYTREVFRVDYLGVVTSGGSGGGGGDQQQQQHDAMPAANFLCERRREVYGCNATRRRFNACPSAAMSS